MPSLCRRGAANRFRLHVGLHPAAGRIFVHGSELTFADEAPLPSNIALLGEARALGEWDGRLGICPS